MGAHDIAYVMCPDSGTAYGSSPTVSTNKNGRDAGRRTLVRTDRQITNMKMWGLLPSSAEIGPYLLRDKKSGVFFPEVTWRDNKGAGIRHWLRIRPPLRQQNIQPANIQFVTGTCLFGRSGATMNLANGSRRPLVSNRLSLPSPVRSLSICNDLSFYELDTVCRLSSVIGNMAEQYTQPTRVYVHIPQPEYVLVMFGHRRGARGKSVMREWLKAVERRGSRVGALFNQLLATSSTTQVAIGSPLDASLMPFLRDCIEQDITPSPDELMEIISHSNGMIGDLLSLWLAVRKDNRAIDYYDLAHFGYVAGVALNLADQALTIEVDNPSEEPIFRALSRVHRHPDMQALEWPGNAMAIYPYAESASSPDKYMFSQTPLNENGISHSILSQYGFNALQTPITV